MKQISETAVIHSNACIGKNVIIKEYAVIYPGAIIENDVEIGAHSIIKNNVTIRNNTFIGDHVIIGENALNYYKDKRNYENKVTVIGEHSIVRSNSVIYEDVNIGDIFQSGHHITIREDTTVGNNCSIGTFCDIQGKVNIGDFVRLHSSVHVGQYAIIEDFVWMYPFVVLTNDPYPPLGNLKGVVVKEYAQVATAAILMPGITIGKNALVGASTLVRSDVPEESVIVGNPGRIVCSVRDLKDDEGKQIYPWKDYLKDYRGYPWQNDHT